MRSKKLIYSILHEPYHQNINVIKDYVIIILTPSSYYKGGQRVWQKAMVHSGDLVAIRVAINVLPRCLYFYKGIVGK